MTQLTMKKPVLVFFQEIKYGDLLKHKAKSNVSDTGGGARDLRIRPAEGFIPILSKMFPDVGPEEGVLQGTIHWFNKHGEIDTAVIEFWRPTDARPGEARIGKTYEISSWTVNEDEFGASLQRAMKWFYLLVMDADGVVWASILREEDLPKQNARIASYVSHRIADTKPVHAVRGSINFDNGKVYP